MYFCGCNRSCKVSCGSVDQNGHGFERQENDTQDGAGRQGAAPSAEDSAGGRNLGLLQAEPQACFQHQNLMRRVRLKNKDPAMVSAFRSYSTAC
jgi:hypothetical protein